MTKDSRLSAALHALLHMAEHDGPTTSETLARCMRSHAALVRRTMAGLRQNGLVRSEKGHGGGWRLARDLNAITLRDVHEALGAPEVFAIGNRSPAPQCLVEQAVNHALADTLEQAEAMLVRRFGIITLASLSADFHRRLEAVKKDATHAA
ncbi:MULTISPECIES: Rrf2 family transcriptional regulator [Roseomonadaceae]|uniref:Rrf2 family transcriptional regulator n=1 Tax=Falsiroseomonas oleicola TaxID=2801474 RepID=A0ABS6H2J1_9PROT|nr:Rrf2 family transcriptional regulator [Roseomonas oleicola]MBU8542887.1 Rrf2 family transcriptional regulator [Roseomonas oleicola]